MRISTANQLWIIQWKFCKANSFVWVALNICHSTHDSITLTISIIDRLPRQEGCQMAQIIYEFQWQRFIKWLSCCLKTRVFFSFGCSFLSIFHRFYSWNPNFISGVSCPRNIRKIPVGLELNSFFKTLISDFLWRISSCNNFTWQKRLKIKTRLSNNCHFKDRVLMDLPSSLV